MTKNELIKKLYGIENDLEVPYYTIDEMLEIYEQLCCIWRQDNAMRVFTYPVYYYANLEELMPNGKVNFYKMTTRHWEQLYKLEGGVIFFDSGQAQKIIDILKDKC